MMFGIEIYEVDAALPDETQPAAVKHGSMVFPPNGQEPTAWMADGNDDRSAALAGRLMDRAVKVRCTTKPTKLGAIPIPRGSFIVTRKDNQAFSGDLAKTMTDTAKAFDTPLIPITSGMGAGDLPDIGGQFFVLLETPRVAILTGDPFDAYNVGELWHLTDHELGLRVALLNTPVDATDLRRYNVIIIPDGSPTAPWTHKNPALKSWVESGGTLIAIGNSAGALAKDKTGIGSTRLLPDVITKLDPFRQAIIKDWLAKNQTPDPAQVWSNDPPEKMEYPWALGEQEKLDDDEAKRRDQYRDLFMPTGASSPPAPTTAPGSPAAALKFSPSSTTTPPSSSPSPAATPPSSWAPSSPPPNPPSPLSPKGWTAVAGAWSAPRRREATPPVRPRTTPRTPKGCPERRKHQTHRARTPRKTTKTRKTTRTKKTTRKKSPSPAGSSPLPATSSASA